MNYREALAWLYATQRFGIKLGLENIERLLHAQGLESFMAKSAAPPPSKPKVIHVAGTNGKGSVCAMIDSIARLAGYRAGLFTSPHLVSFRERIRVTGKMISESEVARGLSETRALVNDWEPHPTFFEIITALALQHFLREGCELVVLETGMGGRLDATNAIQSDVSVITPIDFDHEKWLGYSLTEIAREKAGIIKPRIPIISSPQKPEALAVIEQHARECDAPLTVANEKWTKSMPALTGLHQQSNAAAAIAALRALGASPSDDTIARGLSFLEWPARFQHWNERMVVDGAHNPAGARVLVETWREEFGDERAIIILAVLRDKNTSEIITILAPIASQLILPKIRSERAVPPPELLSSITPPLRYSITASTAEALSLAEKQAGRILITGSLHFAGEALAILRGDPDSLEDCAQ